MKRLVCSRRLPLTKIVFPASDGRLMHSCIYEGWVSHHRRGPIEHRFRYPLSMVYLDLDEIGQAFEGNWLWSANRPALAWLRRADYLGDARHSIPEAVRGLLKDSGVNGADGPIRLLTHPRYFGFLMNPVSFYFCFDESGQQLRAVVADVTNTPWKQRKAYVLRGDDWWSRQPGSSVRVPKELHVSPFLPMEMEYGWRLNNPGPQLKIGIRNYQQDQLTFTATLQLTRQAWSAAALRRVLWRHPFMTQRVAAGIYWQALLLWWKGCRVYSHPSRQTAALIAAAARNP